MVTNIKLTKGRIRMIHGEVEWLVPGETPSKGSNQIQAEASEILASLAGEGSRKIDAFYLVFENTESADSEVVCSGIDASDGVEYFLGLAGSRDFIRQKMELPPEIQGTSVTFPILASSGYGFHGLPFGQDGTVSQVCAMALVSAHPTDPAQDKVFAFKVWDPPKVKTSEQLYTRWTIYF